ncbi:PucR family transcriptional regulator ligand-binding domain-containing protein [Streptomyces sp. NPDC086989]|uniref:helix-turn-helix domain-containing protein n=1 Tax=Streptomyces sp. NPDC086989 TaxID=3365764 RepID=UPI003815337E
MHLLELLESDDLGLTLLWGEELLLGQEVNGVTATDLEDPSRFLGPGELVLSGLVWWTHHSPGKADRFVAALADAGAAALLAGEETHGHVPEEVVKACRAHRLPVVAVPARTSFRTVTEAVYLRQWGDLSRRRNRLFALPENVRAELGRLLERGAEPDELLDRACAHLGRVPCYLLTASGRTLARTASAPPIAPGHPASARSGLSLHVKADSSPYDAWYLHVPDADAAPPRVLHEIAGVLAQLRDGQAAAAAAARSAGQDLVRLLEGAWEPGLLDEALTTAGLPLGGPYRVVAATSGDALAEALGHLPDVPAAVGESTAVLFEGAVDGPDVLGRLRTAWALVQACAGPEADLCVGAGARADTAEQLAASSRQARFALTAADRQEPVRGVEHLSTLAELLAGVPAEVRQVFGTRTLGALRDGILRQTLEVFLAHNCSWARTAEALHLHVNTVHYRIERVEVLTGRDLSRLDHKLDLYAALQCA